jgi:hypothetical protein
MGQDPTSKAMRCAPRSGEVVNRCCGGKNLGPVEDHEAPSEDDIERFGSATRVCPSCKTEVYDEAELCHNCGHAFSGADERGYLPAWAIMTGVVVIAAFVIGVILTR